MYLCGFEIQKILLITKNNKVITNTKNGAVIEFLSDWKKIEHGMKKREAKVSFSCPFYSQQEIDEVKKRFKEWEKGRTPKLGGCVTEVVGSDRYAFRILAFNEKKKTITITDCDDDGVPILSAREITFKFSYNRWRPTEKTGGTSFTPIFMFNYCENYRDPNF